VQKIYLCAFTSGQKSKYCFKNDNAVTIRDGDLHALPAANIMSIYIAVWCRQDHFMANKPEGSLDSYSHVLRLSARPFCIHPDRSGKHNAIQPAHRPAIPEENTLMCVGNEERLLV
jgi:hypothetical protein